MVTAQSLNNPQTLNLQLESDLQQLNSLLERFEELYQPWILRKDWLQCQLALAEGFTNAVRHAHRYLPPQTPIEIKIILTAETLEIQIWDRGEPFDMLGYLQQLQMPSPQLTSHGQGLPILQRIATHLDYVRTPEPGNCLIIIKKLSSTTG